MSKPDARRLDWASSMIATIVVLVLVVSALTGLEFLFSKPQVTATAIAPAATTPMAAPSAGPNSAAASMPEQDPVAFEACRRLVANRDTSDLPLMIDIGSAAAQSVNDSIRTNGNLLRTTAQIAAINNMRGATPQQQIKDRNALTATAAQLLDSCYLNGL